MIVVCSEKNTFHAGSDLDMLFPITRVEDAVEVSKSMHRFFRTVEALKVPTVAALEGSCLGCGLELAISCSYRVAARKPLLIIGLPEVKFGIIPGGGAVRNVVCVVQQCSVWNRKVVCHVVSLWKWNNNAHCSPFLCSTNFGNLLTISVFHHCSPLPHLCPIIIILTTFSPLCPIAAHKKPF